MLDFSRIITECFWDIEITKDSFVKNDNFLEIEKLEALFTRSNNSITVTKSLAIDTDGISE